MKRHVAFLAFRQVRNSVFRPLIGLGEQHSVGEVRVDVCSQFAQERVCFGQILAIGVFALEEVGNCVEPEPVHAEAKPERYYSSNFPDYRRVVVVQIRLMRVESMEVICLAHRIPRPVGRFEVPEDDPRVLVALRSIAPHIVIAIGTTCR